MTYFIRDVTEPPYSNLNRSFETVEAILEFVTCDGSQLYDVDIDHSSSPVGTVAVDARGTLVVYEVVKAA